MHAPATPGTSDSGGASGGDPEPGPDPDIAYRLGLTSNDSSLGKVKIGSGPTGASVQQDIASGSSVQIQAIAESGAQFQKWPDDNTNATRTVTVNASISLQAIFVAEEPDENPEDGNNPEDEDYGEGVPNEDGGITY